MDFVKYQHSWILLKKWKKNKNNFSSYFCFQLSSSSSVLQCHNAAPGRWDYTKILPLRISCNRSCKSNSESLKPNCPRWTRKSKTSDKQGSNFYFYFPILTTTYIKLGVWVPANLTSCTGSQCVWTSNKIFITLLLHACNMFHRWRPRCAGSDMWISALMSDCCLTECYFLLRLWRCCTCQQICGDFLSKMYCVSGEGSSSYLSKGTLSITMGSASTQEKRTCGWAERGGWGGSEEHNVLKNINKSTYCLWCLFCKRK